MKNSFKNRAHTLIFSHFLERSLIIVLVAMSLSWLVTRNPSQSVLLGLLMLPASYIGDRIKTMQMKQRKQDTQTNLAKEIQGIEIRLMDLENYEEQVYQAISAAQNFNHSLESENQRLRTERFDLSEQISFLQNKQHELVQYCAELNPQKEELQTKLDELDRKIKAANNQKSEIEKELLEKSYNLKVVENSCTFIRQELEQLNQDILEKMQYKENVCRAINVLEQQIQHSILQSQDLTQKEQALHCTLASL